jgi:hypothetical protein
MPADGFDAAVKNSGPRHVPLAALKGTGWKHTSVGGMSKEAWRSITLRGIETVSFRKVSVAEFQNPGADTGSQPLNESPAQRAGFLFLLVSSAAIND